MDTLTTVNNAMKDNLLDGMTDAIVEEYPLLNELRTKASSEKIEWYGRNIIRVVKTKKPSTAAAVAESADIPDTGERDFEQMSEVLRYLYVSTGLTAQTMELGTGGKASFVNMMVDALSDLKDDAERGMTGVAQRDGSGALAKVSAVNGQVITFDNVVGTDNIPYNDVDGFYEGMRLEFFTAKTGGAQHNATLVIDSIDKANKQITVVGTCDAVADNDFAFIKGSRGIEPKGFQAWIQATGGSNGSATLFQGVTRSSFRHLQARIYTNPAGAGTKRKFQTSLLEDAYDDVRQGTGKGKIKLWLMGLKRYRDICRREFQNQNYVNKREIYPGCEVPEFPAGAAIAPMLGMMNEYIQGVDPNDIHWATKKEFEWMKRHGDVWFPTPGSRADQYEAWARMWFNFWVDRCDNMVSIRDLEDV